jgi:hypothetical protein
MKKLIFLLTLCLAAAVQAQVIATNIPRTQYAAFNARADVFLIRGTSVIGTMNNQINFPVEVRAERLTDPATNNVYAVSLRTKLNQETLVDYVDYDELDTLIQGVEAIAQANSSSTPFDNYEAVVRTKCGLSIAKIGKGTKVTIAMTSGATTNLVHNEMASFVLDDFARYLTAAKAKIDSIIASGQ